MRGVLDDQPFFMSNRRKTGNMMDTTVHGKTDSDIPSRIASALGRRSVVFVGLMGAGKTAIGRGTAHSLSLPFADSDHEIEHASRMTIPELFEEYGEAEFRSLERRVISRLLKTGPSVISTGGGAFMNESTRRAIRSKGISIWLKADLDTLMSRVARKQNRPLLKNDNPRKAMAGLMDSRYPVYAKADITIITRDERKEVITEEVVAALAGFLGIDIAGEPSGR